MAPRTTIGARPSATKMPYCDARIMSSLSMPTARSRTSALKGADVRQFVM